MIVENSSWPSYLGLSNTALSILIGFNGTSGQPQIVLNLRKMQGSILPSSLGLYPYPFSSGHTALMADISYAQFSSPSRSLLGSSASHFFGFLSSAFSPSFKTP